MQRLLIVDDDTSFSNALSQVLSQDYQVKTAATLKEAVGLISNHPFDSIVADFILASDTGFDLLNCIRDLQPKPSIIFVTAFASKEMAISLLNEGVEGMLEKPFEIADLKKMLAKKLHANAAAADHQFQLFPRDRIVKIDESSVELTEVEFKLLSYLIAHRESWVTRPELLQYIWGESYQSRNILDTHLTNLKNKLPILRTLLKAVRGRGILLENYK